MNKFATVFLSFRHHLIVGFLLRLILIVYGNYHDQNFQVPYTDVDYKVFTDAARHVFNGGSPYERHTYRYTPIIAWLLVPNLLIDLSFGKIIFSLIDLFAAVLIKCIIRESVSSSVFGKNKVSKIETLSNLGMVIWLYNPITVGIATRGNSDSIAASLVLLTLYLLQCKRWYFAAGLIHGLAVHVRLYPIIYSLAIYLYLSKISSVSKEISVEKRRKEIKSKRTLFKKDYLPYFIPNFDRIKLVAGCFLTLSVLTGLFYHIYGYQFLFESYIYHLIRKDIRHNFSLYFYLQYLTAGVNVGIWQKILTNLPQLVLFVVFSIKFGINKSSLNFCILLLTCIFVTYNSVITSQYFVWILAILPLCIWQIRIDVRTGVLLGLFWVGAQALWLFSAYLLEFQGLNMFIYIWLHSVSFFCANIACVAEVIKGFQNNSKMKVL